MTADPSTSRPKKPPMVDWYAPGQLLKTGAYATLSALLGAAIDTRRMVAFEGSRDDSVLDCEGAAPFSFDYMADTGDGWDSTYTMAVLVTAPELTVGGLERPLPRSDLLILGGDQVYPVASKQAYARRLVWPFRQAARDLRTRLGASRLRRRPAYMVPGNHDWYDSLGAMTRRFFATRSSGRLYPKDLGQFDCRQVRSYFVLKLPCDWEVWAVDVQLGRDIDPEQFAFFREHAGTVRGSTKIVLCVAEPTIVNGEGVEAAKESLVFGMQRIQRLAYNRGARVLVQLAGDTHNYQRYVVERKSKAGPYRRHHFVCGGGGAFLHPTHSFHRGSPESPRREPAARYPDRRTSRRLAWRNLAFAVQHMGMSALIGTLYVLLFWSSGVPHLGTAGLLDTLAAHVVGHPGSALVALVLVGGCVAFAGKRYPWGLLHGAAHLGTAVLCWRLAAGLVAHSAPVVPALQERFLVLVLGGLGGGTLFGLYLLASLNGLRMHHNEAFSSLAWPHHKSFLRCTIEPDGGLRVRVLAVPRTAGAEAQHPVAVELVEEVRIPG